MLFYVVVYINNDGKEFARDVYDVTSEKTFTLLENICAMKGIRTERDDYDTLIAYITPEDLS